MLKRPSLLFLIAVILATQVHGETADEPPRQVESWEYLAHHHAKWIFVTTNQVSWAEGEAECRSLNQTFRKSGKIFYGGLKYKPVGPWTGENFRKILNLAKNAGLKKDIWGDYNDGEGYCAINKWLDDLQDYCRQSENGHMVPCDTKLVMFCVGTLPPTPRTTTVPPTTTTVTVTPVKNEDKGDRTMEHKSLVRQGMKRRSDIHYKLIKFWPYLYN